MNLVFDSDDFGCNHVISDQTQSHDCRDVLLKFKEINPKFKATLFTILGETTPEITAWAQNNKDWIELAVHGFFHQTNYECEKLSYDDFGFFMNEFTDMTKYFVKGFKAPGWQISDDIYRWLKDHDYWVADQSYNDERRPEELKAYINDGGQFSANGIQFNGQHFHTWDCVGNGVYEKEDYIIEQLGTAKEFKFVSEAINEAYNNDKQ